MWQLLSRLFGRDTHTQRMKALHDIDCCHSRLSEILSKSIVDPEFDEERKALEKVLDDFRNRLKGAVTYNDWWATWERKLSASRGASDRAA